MAMAIKLTNFTARARDQVMTFGRLEMLYARYAQARMVTMDGIRLRIQSSNNRVKSKL